MHDTSESWHNSNIHVFWKEIAARRRTVQLYENERSFLLTLEGFAGSGLLANERVVVIASREHLDQLHFRLQQQFATLHVFMDSGQYIPMDVADLQALVMPEGTFSPDLFYDIMFELLSREGSTSQLRIYSEISVTLMALNLTGMLKVLDETWNKLYGQLQFTHLRAFPRSLLKTSDIPLAFYDDQSILIQGDVGSSTEVSYKQYQPIAL